MREGLYPLGLSGGGHFDRAPFSGTSILVPQLLRKPTWLGKWHFGQAYSFGLFGRTRALPKSIIPTRHQIQRYFMTRPPSRSSSPTACRGSPIPGRSSCNICGSSLSPPEVGLGAVFDDGKYKGKGKDKDKDRGKDKDRDKGKDRGKGKGKGKGKEEVFEEYIREGLHPL